VDRIINNHAFQVQKTAQTHGMMARMFQDSASANQGTDIGQWLVASQSQNGVIRALQGQAAAEKRLERNLDGELNGVYVPKMQSFTDEVMQLTRQASKLDKQPERTQRKDREGTPSRERVVEDSVPLQKQMDELRKKVLLLAKENQRLRSGILEGVREDKPQEHPNQDTGGGGGGSLDDEMCQRCVDYCRCGNNSGDEQCQSCLRSFDQISSNHSPDQSHRPNQHPRCDDPNATSGSNCEHGPLDASPNHLRPRPEHMEKCPTREVLPTTKHELRISADELARHVYMTVLATEAVYHPPSERSNFMQRQTRSFSRFLIPRNHPQSEHVLVMDVATSNTVIVAYRGTADLTDLWTDMKYPAVPVLGGKVHKGFYDRCKEYDAVLPLIHIAEWIKAGKHVVFTGHSLGGASAIVNTLRLLEEEMLDAQLRDSLACITFASPLVGDKDLQSYVNKHRYAKHFFTYVYETDIVPRILLLKEDLQNKLHKGLTGMKFFEWASEKTTEFLQVRLKDWLSGFVGNAAAGVAVNGASQLGQQFGAWAWEEFNPPYFPFGAYFFCKDGAVKHSDDDAIVKAYMKEITPNLESLMNHEMRRYASALEALRGK